MLAKSGSFDGATLERRLLRRSDSWTSWEQFLDLRPRLADLRIGRVAGDVHAPGINLEQVTDEGLPDLAHMVLLHICLRMSSRANISLAPVTKPICSVKTSDIIAISRWASPHSLIAILSAMLMTFTFGSKASTNLRSKIRAMVCIINSSATPQPSKSWHGSGQTLSGLSTRGHGAIACSGSRPVSSAIGQRRWGFETVFCIGRSANHRSIAVDSILVRSIRPTLQMRANRKSTFAP